MKTLVFDLFGPYAMFRKVFTPISPVSYPFPPPPTVIGMIGAICGYNKDEYLEKIGWDTIHIGISIKNPIKRYRAGINLINTKGNKYFRLVGENPHVQIPHEFLKDVHYRIFISDANENAMKDLEKHLSEDTNVYTVSLGLAQCLAEVKFIGSFESKALPHGTHEISTVIPREQAEDLLLSGGKSYGLFRIPVRMQPNRVVAEYSEVIVDESGLAIKVVTSKAQDVGGENVLFF